jgi:ketosteroid isomerase-like protein
MQGNEQAQVIRQYIAAYNAFDVSGMLKLLSPEVRFENWSGAHLTAEASGIDEFRQLAEQARTMFSEREQRITAFKQSADSVIVSIAYRGRLAVDIPDGPRAGTVLDLNGESEFAFDGRLISKIVDRSQGNSEL